jgi:hypothetical protein
MPGFTTHYLFGAEAYKRLTSARGRRILREHHGAYALGLQGPDVFFYYLPSYLLHATNLGALAHEKETGAFFSNLLESRQHFAGNEEELATADAYIAGFLGHYTLDCTAHPYVYAFTSYNPQKAPKHTEYFGQHAYLETEIDGELLWEYRGIKPTRFRQNRTIHMRPMEKRVIAWMLTYAYHYTYHVLVTPQIMRGAMRWMRTGTRLANDPTGQKKVMVRYVEKWILDRPFISPMLPSDHYRFVPDPLNERHRTWVHPWTGAVSTDTFPDLFRKAGEKYDARLGAYMRMVEHGFTRRQTEAFLREYGNRSFLSGEPLPPKC